MSRVNQKSNTEPKSVNVTQLTHQSLTKRGINVDYRLLVCASVVSNVYFKYGSGSLTKDEAQSQIDEAIRIYQNPGMNLEVF